MGDFFNSVLYPIEWVVAWIMYGFHSFFTTIGMPAASGWTWGLSIVGLVIVMRALLIPLFVKQINASRKMQMISPEIQKIQAKYKGKTDPESRQKMTQETMELYRTTGTNPFSSCLPILAQSPIFFGLFRVLNGLQAIADGRKDGIGPITAEVARQAEQAQIFGAQLSDRFIGSETLNVKIVTILLIVLMSVTTFTTQRQLMTKNMPASALDNPFARQQKVLLYVLLVFAISGVNFPIGVLIYWFVTNVWSMGQQFYVIRRNPTPGSLAEKALNERRARKGKAVPQDAASETVAGSVIEDGAKVAGQRQQPKRKDRQRKPASGQTAQVAGSGQARSQSSPQDQVLPAKGQGAPAKGQNQQSKKRGSQAKNQASQPRKKQPKQSPKGPGSAPEGTGSDRT